MLCGGHVARAHINKLKKMAGIKTFTERYMNKYRVKFPDVDTVECCCSGGKHKKRCGCLSDRFIRQARINFYCCLVHSGKDPDSFKKKLCNLGKYHARNIHQWEGGTCDLAYEIECDERASRAYDLIHPVLGRGHSNLQLDLGQKIFIYIDYIT